MTLTTVTIGLCLGVCLTGSAIAGTFTSDDGDVRCLTFSKRDVKIASKSFSHRIDGIWPTKKDSIWRSTLKKAKTAFVCFGDTFCAFDLCVRSAAGAYLDGKGEPVARISGLKGWDSAETCWLVTINGGDAGTICR